MPKLLPILDPAFNVREIVKQFLLLEDHLLHPRKRCSDCIKKHLLTAEALAEEAVSLDVSGKAQKPLWGLAESIRRLWVAYHAGKDMHGIAEAVRKLRKQLQPIASKVKVASSTRVAARYGETRVDEGNWAMSYPSILLRTQRDYGEGSMIAVPRGLPGEVEEHKEFLQSLGHKMASDSKLLHALHTIDTVIKEARQRIDRDAEAYFLDGWFEAKIPAVVQAVAVVDAAFTGKAQRNKAYDEKHVRELLSVQSDYWEVYLSDGGYSRFVIQSVAESGPTMHFDPGLAGHNAKVVWDRLVSEGHAQAGGHFKVGASSDMVEVNLRVAARYQKKKEVPKANGKGTTVVYEYSERQVQNRNRDKAERIEKLRGNMDKLRTQFMKDLTDKDPKTRLAALAVALMAETYERVGNSQSAEENEHFGVTTWQVQHVTLSAKKATIKYVGKSGVDHVKEVTTPKILSALRKAMTGKDKDAGLLCEGEDCTVVASDVNEYLKPFDITAKDIRGLGANQEMQSQLKAVRSKGGKLPEDKKERETKLKAEFKKALETTAEIIGHTPSMLRNNYLVPGLEEEYVKDGATQDNLDKKGARKFATKSYGEREDEAAEALIHKSPKKKPPRMDLRNHTFDPDADRDKEKPDKDQSMNYKDIGASAHRVANMYLCGADTITPPKAKHSPGQVWKTKGGWRGMRSETEQQTFPDKAQAESYVNPDGTSSAEDKPESGPKKTPTPEMIKGLEVYPHMREYSDEELQDESGEYFENGYTQALAPGMFKDPADFIQQVKDVPVVEVPKEFWTTPDNNADAPEILMAGENGLDKAKAKAQEYGKDLERVLEAFGDDGELPPPLLIRDKDNNVYLMAGNTRMMAAVAVGKKLPVKVIDYDGVFDREAAQEAEATPEPTPEPSDIPKEKPKKPKGKPKKPSSSPLEHFKDIPLGTTPLEDPSSYAEQRKKIAEESYEFYSKKHSAKKLQEYTDQLATAYDGVDPDSPRGIEIRAIYHGIALAAAARGLEIPSTKSKSKGKGKNEGEDTESDEPNTKLSVDSPESLSKLAQILSVYGEEKMLLGTVGDMTSPEARSIFTEAIRNLSDEDLDTFMGEGSPITELHKSLLEETDPENRKYIRNMIETLIVDGISLLEPLGNTRIDGEGPPEDIDKAKAKVKAARKKSEQQAASAARHEIQATRVKGRPLKSALDLITKLLRREHITSFADNLAKEFPDHPGKSIHDRKVHAIQKEKSFRVLNQRVVRHPQLKLKLAWDFTPWPRF